MIRIKTFSLLLISSLSLSACSGVGMLTGAAAVTGISAAQEGGLDRAYNDTKIKVMINRAWFEYDVEAFTKLSTTINQGRVLITGVVQNPEHRVEAVRLAWQASGVTQVINEIRVANSEGITGFVKDGWITSKLRAGLTFDRGVQSINYSIDTVQSVVYLMGVAQNQQELNRVIEKARTTSGVKQVVSYVKLAGEPLADNKQANTANRPTSSQSVQSPQQNNVQNQAPSQPVYNSNSEPYNQPAYQAPTSNNSVRQNTAPQSLNTNTNARMDSPKYSSDYQPEYIDDDIAVPARSVPENAPSIEDQYYNN